MFRSGFLSVIAEKFDLELTAWGFSGERWTLDALVHAHDVDKYLEDVLRMRLQTGHIELKAGVVERFVRTPREPATLPLISVLLERC